MHGAIYLYLKTEEELQQVVHRWMWRGFGLTLIAYMLATIFTLAMIPGALQNFQRHPWSWAIVVLTVLAFANIPRAIFLGGRFMPSHLLPLQYLRWFFFSASRSFPTWWSPAFA